MKMHTSYPESSGSGQTEENHAAADGVHASAPRGSTKDLIRQWIKDRNLNHAPLPDMAQIKRALDW